MSPQFPIWLCVSSEVSACAHTERFPHAFYSEHQLKKLHEDHTEIISRAIGLDFVFDPIWINSTTTALAQMMYDSKEFSAMPILADALQDADCAEEGLLKKMRSPEPLWFRGNRIIDELLQKRS